MHHGYIDQLWFQWQSKDVKRKSEYIGSSSGNIAGYSIPISSVLDNESLCYSYSNGVDLPDVKASTTAATKTASSTKSAETNTRPGTKSENKMATTTRKVDIKPTSAATTTSNGTKPSSTKSSTTTSRCGADQSDQATTTHST